MIDLKKNINIEQFINYSKYFHFSKHTARGLSQDILLTVNTMSHGQLFFVNFVAGNVFNAFNLKKYSFKNYNYNEISFKYFQNAATLLTSLTVI